MPHSIKLIFGVSTLDISIGYSFFHGKQTFPCFDHFVRNSMKHTTQFEYAMFAIQACFYFASSSMFTLPRAVAWHQNHPPIQ